MGTRPPTACRFCGKVAETASCCVSCKPKAKESKRQSERWRNDDPANAIYKTTQWIKLSQTLRIYNPMCQVVTKGIPCRYPAALVHHKVSPKQDKSLFLSVPNLVCVCRMHHPPDEGEMRGYLYSPTKWMMGLSYEHTAPAHVMGTREWFEANQ
jgi:hypothetical protein